MSDALRLLTPEKQAILNTATEALRAVPNVVTVVLGGSYARGLARPESDLDIGIYYRDASPLPADRVRSIAESICTPGSKPVVTDLYGWGPWVNGGAWIETPAGKVDFVYRSLDQVRAVIEEGRQGIWRHDYDQQPPYGFRSVVYFGETYYAVPLYDPEGEIEGLKNLVAAYPRALKSRIVQEGLWGAEFSLWMCRGFAASADVFNAVGCMTRAAHYLVHAIFALNEEYFLSDKYTNRIVEQFANRPKDFVARLQEVLAHAGRQPEQLRGSLESLRALWAETVAFTLGTYEPRFDLLRSLP